MPSHRSYILISPCRNEADFMRRTLDSVAAQTVQPSEWIVVDDGSTDATQQILQEYQSRLPFLRVITRQDRGKRSVGPGVIEAFYEGYRHISKLYNYICKLDMDLDLPARYFERLIELMEADPRLGTISGKAYYIDHNTGKQVLELIRDHMSVGASKFCRKECFEETDGFVRQVMWDGIDCHTARLCGWKAGSFDEPDLRFEHLRPMGSSQQNIYVGRKRHGYGQYFMGSSLAFVSISAISRLLSPPKITGAAMMWWGYVEAMLQRKPRYNDPEFIRFLRRWQWMALTRGTQRATEKIDEERKEIWEKKWGRGKG
ncbi:MAG: glycosyltransferase family 2 protein [Planctomycetota bacterium]|jgi:biofilm PGA synthesis N-glycosyltransferase PgaC